MIPLAEIDFSNSRSTIELHKTVESLLPLPDSGIAIFDENTAPLLKLPENYPTLTLPPGEKTKQWHSIEAMLNIASKLRLNRNSSFIGIGGGVITDMAAFAGSLYMRGCRVILIPTTLLAMVDAAIGGKTGIDFNEYKNRAGTFYPAHQVQICPAFLTTLSKIEFHSGLAEVIKHALLDGEEFLALMEREQKGIMKRNATLLEEIIRRSAEVKSAIVKEDLTEQAGLRESLNLGHTFAHALEETTGFSRYTHGQAVGWGIFKALDLGVNLGLTSPAYRQRVTDLLRNYGFTDSYQADGTQLKNAFLTDKKVRGGSYRFVVPCEPGRVELVTLSKEEEAKIPV